MKIRILIADDHKIMCDGIRLIVEEQPDMTVVGLANDGLTALRLAQELKPDIIIMDVNMPNLSGIEVSRKLMSQLPQTKIIALSAYANKWFVRHMFQSGASGYMLKECAKDELVKSIRTVCEGKVYLAPNIAYYIIEDHIKYLKKNDNSLPSILSSRECQVLQLVAEGKTTKDIALTLSLSAKTVENHRHQIMNKLGLFSIAELTRYAIREGLIPPSV